MTTPQLEFGIDEYFRKRLMPVEGAIPQLNGIDMHGDSIPAALAGGDLFEYINFEQRCNIDARIAHALGSTRNTLSRFPITSSLATWWMRMWSGCDPRPALPRQMKRSTERPRRQSNRESLKIYNLSTRQRGCSWLTPKVTTLSRQRLPQPCTTHSMRSCFRTSTGTEGQRRKCSRESICAWVSPLLRAMS